MAFCVSPSILLKYGERLREKSKFAGFSKRLEQDENNESTQRSNLSAAQEVVKTDLEV